MTKLASEYKCRPVGFLDGGMLPTKMIVMAGLGGVGKGTCVAGIVADLTRGRPTLGLVYNAPGSIDVLMIGSEDGYEDTVVPRLAAAGADLARVHFLEYATNEKGERQPFSLNDIEALRKYLAKHPTIRAVFIDPISGYVGRAGSRDNNEAEIRALLDTAQRPDQREGRHDRRHQAPEQGRGQDDRQPGRRLGRLRQHAAGLLPGRQAPAGRKPPGHGAFKWNLNAAPPSPTSWALEKVPAAEADRIVAENGADDLDDAGKAQLRDQLNRVRWLGPCDVGAEELIKAATSLGRTGPGNEVETRREVAQGTTGRRPGRVHGCGEGRRRVPGEEVAGHRDRDSLPTRWRSCGWAASSGGGRTSSRSGLAACRGVRSSGDPGVSSSARRPNLG